MDPSIKFFFVLLVAVGVLSLFVPIVTNPNPVDCNNYPDGTGGYYLKCKDEHISLYKKWTLPKNTPETRQRTF
jgi:hypothetical protein